MNTDDPMSNDGEYTFPTPSIEYEYVWMKELLFLAILALDGLVLLFCFCCVLAIILYRRHLTIVNTGFALTYTFIFGCVLILMSVPLFGIDSNLTSKISIPKACMARIWLLSVGYSLSVGIMIVRIIYTAFMELIRDFKNYQIPSLVTLFFVISMAIIDTMVVIAWRWFSPPHKDYVIKEIEYIGIHDQRRTVVETCNSEKESLLISFLCFYKGGLLLVALIISIFRKEEEEKRSDDFNRCQIGLLSVLVAGAIALPVVLSLPYNPNKSFAVGGVVVILEVLFLMTWVKASKIFNAHKCKKGEALEFGKYSVERSPRFAGASCVRPVYGCIYNVKNQGLVYESFPPDFDSSFYIKGTGPEDEKREEEDDNLGGSGIGFDSKVSEDILPSDLPSLDEYNLKPYDPDAEVEKEEEESASDAEYADGTAEGDTSDDDDTSSSDDSENENTNEDASSSSSALARSTVSVHVNKSVAGSQVIEEQNKEEDQARSLQSGRKGWWKPLFGSGNKPTENKKDMSAKNVQPVEESGSKTEIMATSTRSGTPEHDASDDDGGSASSDSDSDSD